jgi:hypothetical protein
MPVLVLAGLILFAVGVAAWVVKPLLHSATEAVGVVATILVGAAQAVGACYQLACEQASNSDQLKALVGEPLSFPPLEQVRFLTSNDPLAIEFTFSVSGPQETADARATCKHDGVNWQLVHMHVTSGDGQSFELTQP